VHLLPYLYTSTAYRIITVPKLKLTISGISNDRFIQFPLKKGPAFGDEEVAFSLAHLSRMLYGDCAVFLLVAQSGSALVLSESASPELEVYLPKLGVFLGESGSARINYR